MKKTLITLIGILVAVGIVLGILGRGDEYSAEKLFFRAMKNNEKITMNPEIALPNMLAKVERDLKAVLRKYPKSNAAKAAHMTLAEFYITHEKYNDAIATLDEILAKEGQDAATLSKVYFYKGVCYERQDEWDKALEQYAILRDEYVNTSLGLQTPLYIAKYYIRNERMEDAAKAYSEAIGFYKNLEEQARGQVLGYATADLLRQSHIDVGQFEEAGKVVEAAINNYPADFTYMQQLPYIEAIYEKVLKQPERALQIYRTVRGKTQDENLLRLLDKKIGELGDASKVEEPAEIEPESGAEE